MERPLSSGDLPPSSEPYSKIDLDSLLSGIAYSGEEEDFESVENGGGTLDRGAVFAGALVREERESLWVGDEILPLSGFPETSNLLLAD